MVTKLVAKSIAYLLPAPVWYRVAFIFTKYYAKLSKAPYGSYVRDRFGHSFRMNHALKLEAVLHQIDSDPTINALYPVPVIAEGEPYASLKTDWPNGLMLFSIHTPLNLAGIRHVLNQGLIPDGIVARFPPEGGCFTITGTKVQIPAIPVDDKVLFKVKKILQQGGTVVALVDNLADGSFSINQFRLAYKLNAAFMLVVVELLPDGTIRDRLIQAPFECRTEDDLKLMIKAMNEDILAFVNHEYV